jgi:hypothetical protein
MSPKSKQIRLNPMETKTKKHCDTQPKVTMNERFSCIEVRCKNGHVWTEWLTSENGKKAHSLQQENKYHWLVLKSHECHYCLWDSTL